ncbi:MAG TPA: SAM-dependent methyltransferase, partial [Acidimicrobiales bacterium]
MASLGDAGSANVAGADLIRFDRFMELALYHPATGFYARAGGPAGRRDFLTSPGAGPLFGAVLARALDRWWRELGAPETLHVVEAGAGDGSLARAVLRAEPACLPALEYTAVERSESLRRLHPPEVTSAAEMPAGKQDGVVLANELLDNLPFRLLERAAPGRTGDTFRDIPPESVTSSGLGRAGLGWAGLGWAEVFVDGDGREATLPADAEAAAEAERLAPDAPTGSRIPLQHQAAGWLRAARASLRRGRVVVIDYADERTADFATTPWRDWLRTYRSNGPGTAPTDHPGRQDITCEVAIDQLAAVAPPTTNRSQTEFLDAHGINDLAAEARHEWQARAHIG